MNMDMTFTLTLGEAIQFLVLFGGPVVTLAVWLWRRSLKMKFCQSRVEDMERQLNAVKTLQSLADMHLDAHYQQMGNALLPLVPHKEDTEEIRRLFVAYDTTQKGLLKIKQGGREGEKKAQEDLQDAQDALRKARWGI